ncbi:hypothetical protein [Absidia glauca]|uniref:Uncharacterized protein n=1 Tax=Absidia glauca TaxID=4829 RepID=A0A168M4X1_ABSGL|nr:hypothetical protein [Absidia glauca]
MRADAPQLICVFLLDLIPGEEKACRSIPDEKKLSPSYAQDSSQGLREFPAISVLIVRKIQHTQLVLPRWFCLGGSVCSIPLVMPLTHKETLCTPTL